MDEPLRNRFWGVLYRYFLADWERDRGERSDQMLFVTELWVEHFKLRLDLCPPSPVRMVLFLQASFFPKVKSQSDCWYDLYDLVEFLFKYKRFHQEELRDALNLVLKEELSAYRLISGTFVRLTTEEELKSVTEAVEASDGFDPASAHLEHAARMLSARVNPDFRNSIKESISAVEAICKQVGDTPEAELSQALRSVQQRGIILDRAVERAFKALYGFTSNAEGIRHSMLEEPTIDFEDAKFMLVACAAFVNLLRARGRS